MCICICICKCIGIGIGIGIGICIPIRVCIYGAAGVRRPRPALHIGWYLVPPHGSDDQIISEIRKVKPWLPCDKQ